jgi:hypothetical protein
MYNIGKSPTRLKVYKEPLFIIFDIYSQKAQGFMKYEKAYQEAYHSGIPFVELYGTCEIGSIDNLKDYTEQMLQKAMDNIMEGVVVKSWDFKPEERVNWGIENNCLIFKDKLDYPKVAKVMPEKDFIKVTLMPLPDSEVWGAIAKVVADHGENILLEIKIAMPLIAQYVEKECTQHNCRMPKNLHHYYLQWMKENVK